MGAERHILVWHGVGGDVGVGGEVKGKDWVNHHNSTEMFLLCRCLYAMYFPFKSSVSISVHTDVNHSLCMDLY